MNQEVKTKWLEALRSGEYAQGQGTLKNNNNEYCCIGVLCDLYRKETGNGEFIITESSVSHFKVNGEFGGYGFLPIVMEKWVGEGLDRETQWTLATKNDFGNLNFNAIADFIEEFL